MRLISLGGFLEEELHRMELKSDNPVLWGHHRILRGGFGVTFTSAREPYSVKFPRLNLALCTLTINSAGVTLGEVL